MLQASQVSCIACETHAFMCNLTLTCMNSKSHANLTGLPGQCVAQCFSLVCCKPTKADTLLIKSIVSFPVLLGIRLRCGLFSVDSHQGFIQRWGSPGKSPPPPPPPPQGHISPSPPSKILATTYNKIYIIIRISVHCSRPQQLKILYETLVTVSMYEYTNQFDFTTYT